MSIGELQATTLLVLYIYAADYAALTAMCATRIRAAPVEEDVVVLMESILKHLSFFREEVDLSLNSIHY